MNYLSQTLAGQTLDFLIEHRLDLQKRFRAARFATDKRLLYGRILKLGRLQASIMRTVKEAA